ncbi:glycoside hydrolase family 2, partial [Enterococcus faecalis]|nr:glycoside hydrolase family 2 [Enterococcus faecalis]
VHLESVKFMPKFDEGKVEITANASQLLDNLNLSYEITFGETRVVAGTIEMNERKVVFESELIQEYIFRTNFHNNGWSWTPETPNLFSVKLILTGKNAQAD